MIGKMFFVNRNILKDPSLKIGERGIGEESMNKKIMTIVFLLGLIVLILGCSQQTASPQPQTTESMVVKSTTSVIETPTAMGKTTNQVVIEHFQFGPTTLEINAGDTVEWVNKDSVAHTVTLENGAVDENLPPGGKVIHRFMEAGEYHYVCQFHSSMKGMVIVR